MKKVIMALAGALLVSTSTFAQKDLFSSMESLGSEVKYKSFDISGSDADGYTLTSPSEYFTIEVNKNRFGRSAGFTTIKEDGTKKDKLFNKYYKPDHYTHPIYLTKPSDSWSYRSYYVMVDSIIYRLGKLEDDGSSFEIKDIWIPIVEDKETTEEKSPDEPKKKMSMKEKMAAAKAKAKAFAAGGNYGPLYIKQKSAKHTEIIQNYITGMKKVQASNPITAEVQKELDGLDADKAAEDADIKATNDAYWASEEGQRKLAEMRGDDGNSDYVIIQNNSSSRLYVMTEKGTVSWIAAGGNSKFKCNDDLYNCTTDGSGNHNQRGNLLYSEGSKCGGTLTVQ